MFGNDEATYDIEKGVLEFVTRGGKGVMVAPQGMCQDEKVKDRYCNQTNKEKRKGHCNFHDHGFQEKEKNLSRGFA